jgi:hypothetical protein
MTTFLTTVGKKASTFRKHVARTGIPLLAAENGGPAEHTPISA